LPSLIPLQAIVPQRSNAAQVSLDSVTRFSQKLYLRDQTNNAGHDNCLPDPGKQSGLGQHFGTVEAPGSGFAPP
jgi:hypothetical protein